MNKITIGDRVLLKQPLKSMKRTEGVVLSAPNKSDGFYYVKIKHQTWSFPKDALLKVSA